MRFAVAVVITCAGCKALLGIDEGVVADNQKDAAIDAEVDSAPPDDVMVDADPNACYGQAPFVVCPGLVGTTNGLPTPINTTDNSKCDFIDTTMGRNWCVVVRDDIMINGGIRVQGTRPLVLLARQDLTIGLAGMIDGASHDPSSPGPNANATGCLVAGNGQFNIRGGGGAGGSFGTVGGKGGDGAEHTAPGGAAAAGVVGDTLRGGCKGGRGGNSTTFGGDGGGAIYLVAGHAVQIDGLVNASGAGGSGGQMPGTGGSGGGSGGMIVLSAPTVVVSANAQLFANGGGGGSGAGNNNDGATGGEPTSPAAGGLGGMGGTGGPAGNGAARTDPGQPGTDDGAGGGGGGGGVGRIRVLAVDATVANVTSPPPS